MADELVGLSEPSYYYDFYDLNTECKSRVG